MDKIKKLGGNTIIYFIGTFGSKIISFLLVPFLTVYLTPSDLGKIDLIIMISLVIVPLVSLNIGESVLRFQLESVGSSEKSKVIISNSIFVLAFGGITLFIFTLPFIVITHMDFIVYLYCYFYIMTLSYLIILQQYIKANNKNILFATSSILSSGLLILLSFIFLKILDLGINGVLMAYTLSSFPSIILIMYKCEIFKLIDYNNINQSLLKDMIKFSLPLVPNSIFWWIMQISDRFFIAAFLGSYYVGLYAVTTKLPALINIINSIFTQAWRISAIENKDISKDYYSKVFFILAYSLGIIVSIFILFSEQFFDFLFDPSFKHELNYVGLLFLSTFFSALSAFIETNYMVNFKTKFILYSTTVGAGVNIILNFILIPYFGLTGAAFATLLSFLMTFIVRIVHSKFYKDICYFKVFVVLIFLLFGISIMGYFDKVDFLYADWILFLTFIGVGLIPSIKEGMRLVRI